MKIVIDEPELKEVVADFLREQMPERAGEHFDVKFTAGRGPQGHYAEIYVSKRSDETPAEQTEETNTEETAGKAAVDPFNFGGENDDS